jgi:competence protein ComEC
VKIIFFICLIIFALRFQLPPQLSSNDFIIIGTVASLPESHQKNIQFIFIPDNAIKQKIFLSWYYPPPIHLQTGDKWMLHVQIKPTHKNWILAENINAIGTVKFDFSNQLISRNHWKYPIDHIREIIYKNLKQTLTLQQGLGFISALTLGMRDQITEIQWDDLRGTGTNHLMAIAGLHIGFISGMAYFLMNFLWRRSESLMLWIPAQEAATTFSLVAAFLYSALAGFSLPTQRAIIMLTVFLITYLCRRKILPWTSYFFALGIILALEPLSILTPTFWLSFTAVGLLIYGNSGNIGDQGIWWHLTRAQWIMAIGLIPLSFLFFQQVSLTGFIANCIAIPFIGFIILPLCIVGILFNFFWKIAGFLLIHFWPLIHWLATFPYSQWYHSIHYAELFSIFLAVILFLAPRGIPARWMGLWGFLPLFLHL